MARNIKAIPAAFHELPDHILGGPHPERRVRRFRRPCGGPPCHAHGSRFAPEFVLASWVSPVDELKKPMIQYPAPHWFSDVLVRLREGGILYLNDTDQYAPLGAVKPRRAPRPGACPGDVRDHRAFVRHLCRPHRYRTPPSCSRGGSDIVMAKDLLRELGASFRKQFSEMPPERKRLRADHLLSQPGRRVRRRVHHRYDQYPGVGEVSVQVDTYAVQQGRYLYLKIPGLVNISKG